MTENEVKVLFDDFKNYLTDGKARIHKDSAFFGRLLILFITKILALKMRMEIKVIPNKEKEMVELEEVPQILNNLH